MINLKDLILFQTLTDEECKQCQSALRVREKKFEKGDFLMHAGDRTEWMGIVLSGSVTIESNDAWGNCTILSHVSAGQCFAETYALLPQTVMLVDVRANENCTVLFLNAGSLLNDTPGSPWKEKLLKNLLLITAGKNLALSGRSFHTAPKSCRGRLLSYLNAVSLQKGTTTFDIPFDRQQLADYLNLERTNLSKELGKMQREGIISFKKNHFKIIRNDL